MSSSHNTTHSSSDPRRGSVIVKDSRYGGTNRTGVNTNTTNQSMAKTRVSISTRRRGSVQIGHEKGATGAAAAAYHQKKNIRIMDGDVDVTPMPLLQLSDPSGYSKQSRVFVGGTGSESGFGGPVFGGASLVTPSDVTPSQHNNTLQQQSSADFISKPVWASGEESFRSSKDSVMEDFSEVGAAEPAAVGLADVVTKHHEEIEQLTAEDLEKNVEIVLVETETMWLLDLPGKCVEAGTGEAETVKEGNEKYQKLIKDRVGNDLYADRGMQTFDNGRKMKHAQTNKISVEDKISMATTWDMYDTYMGLAHAEEEQVPDEVVIEAGGSRPETPAAGDDASSIAGSEMSKASVAHKSGFIETKTVNNVSIIRSVQDSVATATNEGTDGIQDSIFAGSSLGNAVSLTESTSQNDIDELKNLVYSENFQKTLFIMERVVVQNIYQPKLAIYRGLPVYQDIDIYLGEVTDDSTSINYQRAPSSAPHASQSREGLRTAGSPSAVSSGPHLEKLWSFSCHLTKDFTVLCMTWNKQNPDILAVGYGQATYRGQSKGIVCCWNIKNIEYPERVFHLESGVTAVDFSSCHPNLLGVGTYDGSVCVFDVATKTDKPVLDNYESAGKHTGPVWEIIWVERERITGDDKGEILVSVSADGRVCQWSIKKGFDYLEVMKLKRLLQSRIPNKSGAVTESLVNRFSSGMGLAFKASDSNLYIAGTEDGHIHRCSCSYNEQFLATYNGHKGPVYRVQWSPFLGDVFMSASADWSMKIWHQDINEPLLSFQPSLKAVTDINWSPFSATIFGCSTEDAVQIFDLSVSTIDPVVTHPVEGRKLTAFAFSRNSPCVIFGDNKGEVSVMKTFNVFSEVQELAAVSSAEELPEIVERQEGKLTDLVEAAVEQVNNKEHKRRKDAGH